MTLAYHAYRNVSVPRISESVSQATPERSTSGFIVVDIAPAAVECFVISVSGVVCYFFFFSPLAPSSLAPFLFDVCMCVCVCVGWGVDGCVCGSLLHTLNKKNVRLALCGRHERSLLENSLLLSILYLSADLWMPTHAIRQFSRLT